MPDRPADHPAVHIEFREFFIFLLLHSTVFIPGILFMHFALCYRRLYVCLRVRMPCFWTSAKRHEIVTSLFFFKLRVIIPDIICKSLTQIRLHIHVNIEKSPFHRISRNDCSHQLWKFDTNLITNSKMANKMVAPKRYNRL